jgi:hypothetical protein
MDWTAAMGEPSIEDGLLKAQRQAGVDGLDLAGKAIKTNPTNKPNG